jgi:hypothetical protein
MSHWKLQVREGKYKLECGVCGRDSGVDFKTDPSEVEIPKCCNGAIEFMLEDGKFKAICEKCEKDLELEADMEPPEHVGCECCTGGDTIH